VTRPRPDQLEEEPDDDDPLDPEDEPPDDDEDEELDDPDDDPEDDEVEDDDELLPDFTLLRLSVR